MKKLSLISTVSTGVATLFSFSVNAALVTADWKTMNDNLLTVDTISKLQWLDVTETGGMSRDEVVAEMGSGGKYEGFRYATSSEVIDLWSQYGITLTPATRTISNTLDTNIITAAQQLGNLYGEQIAASDYGTLGFIAIDNSSPGTTSGWSGAFRENGSSFYEGPTINSFSSGQSRDWLGSYIVTSIVPVPAAAWLFCSGLLGLAGVARRQR